MAQKRYTQTAWDEATIDRIMANRGQIGYSEYYYENKRSFTTKCGKTAWAVDVLEYYG